MLLKLQIQHPDGTVKAVEADDTQFSGISGLTSWLKNHDHINSSEVFFTSSQGELVRDLSSIKDNPVLQYSPIPPPKMATRWKIATAFFLLAALGVFIAAPLVAATFAQALGFIIGGVVSLLLSVTAFAAGRMFVPDENERIEEAFSQSKLAAFEAENPQRDAKLENKKEDTLEVKQEAEPISEQASGQADEGKLENKEEHKLEAKQEVEQVSKPVDEQLSEKEKEKEKKIIARNEEALVEEKKAMQDRYGGGRQAPLSAGELDLQASVRNAPFLLTKEGNEYQKTHQEVAVHATKSHKDETKKSKEERIADVKIANEQLEASVEKLKKLGVEFPEKRVVKQDKEKPDDKLDAPVGGLQRSDSMMGFGEAAEISDELDEDSQSGLTRSDSRVGFEEAEEESADAAAPTGMQRSQSMVGWANKAINGQAKEAKEEPTPEAPQHQ